MKTVIEWISTSACMPENNSQYSTWFLAEGSNGLYFCFGFYHPEKEIWVDQSATDNDNDPIEIPSGQVKFWAEWPKFKMQGAEK